MVAFSTGKSGRSLGSSTQQRFIIWTTPSSPRSSSTVGLKAGLLPCGPFFT